MNSVNAIFGLPIGKSMRTSRITKQLGFTAIELLVVITVAVAGLAMGGEAFNRWSESMANQTASDHAKQVISATQKYTKDNFSALQSTATATTPANITVSMLQSTNYLPASFNALNNYGQSYSIAVLQPVAGKLQTLITTSGGETIQELSLRRIAQQIGAMGGYVSSAAATTATGSYGGWTLSLPGNYGLNPGAGHLAIALFFGDSGTVNDYVYRNSVAGHPELNTMNTPLIMASVQTAGAACTTSGAIAANSSGGVLSCQGGTWKTQGSAYWQDPVANWATLNASYPCNASSAWQTRVVQTPTTGTGPRAYICSGTAWTAISVDDSGNMTLPGILTTGKVLLNDVVTAGTACASNGLVAKDAAGLILSCQSGVWKGAASIDVVQFIATPGTYSFTATRTSMVVAYGWANATTDAQSVISIDGIACSQDRMYYPSASAWATAACLRPVTAGAHTISFGAVATAFNGYFYVMGY